MHTSPTMTEETKTLFFDEAGYTGYDLLSPEQPIFGVASTDIGDDEASEILNHSFPNYQGDEFKFTQLWRRPNHRRNLVRFSERVGNVPERFFFYYCDKKFTALTKVVDTLIEPLFHKSGQDFYKGGFNRQYCNMFHIGLSMLGGPELYDAVLQVYDRFSRAPDEQTLNALQTTYRIMANSGPAEIKHLIEMLATGAEMYHAHNELKVQRKSNDIQFTCVLSSVYHWRTLTEDDLRIVHDASSNFFRQKGFWEQVTSPELRPNTIVSGSGEEVHFPLRVLDTSPGNSKDRPALQLCDVLAGLSCRLRRSPVDDSERGLWQEIAVAGLDELNCRGIYPGTDFGVGTPEKLDGPDAVDQFINAVARKTNKN